MTELPLAAEFPPASREQWLALVEKSLQGTPFDPKLVSRTYDGLGIEPVYPRAERSRPVAGRAPSARWGVVQRLDHPDPAAANVEALYDLENGATGLAILSAGAPSANGYGLRDVSRSEEHTSELQSRLQLVCRLLLEKKKKHLNSLPLRTKKKIIQNKN